MKRVLLIIGAVAFSLTATAQHLKAERHDHGNAEPTVYIISVSEKDIIESPNQGCCDTAMKNAAVKAAIEDHKNATREGTQQVALPSAIFADKRNTFSFAIGGDIALRAAYSFDRTVNNIDMVPYNVPMSLTPADKQEIRMDATTSRIFIRGIANTKKLGQVHIFMDLDFRGGASGSYTPRIRSGYVQMLGLTVGRDVSTFCAPTRTQTPYPFPGGARISATNIPWRLWMPLRKRPRYLLRCISGNMKASRSTWICSFIQIPKPMLCSSTMTGCMNTLRTERGFMT